MDRPLLNTANFPQAQGRGADMIYLLKTEPTAYSFSELVKEKETDWTGGDQTRRR